MKKIKKKKESKIYTLKIDDERGMGGEFNFKDLENVFKFIESFEESNMINKYYNFTYTIKRKEI